MSDSGCRNAILPREDVPTGWTYDPGWTWHGVSAALQDDGYAVAPEPDYDTECGYLIEVNDEQTEAKLLRNDEADRHERLARLPLDALSVSDAVKLLAVRARLDRTEVTALAQ